MFPLGCEIGVCEVLLLVEVLVEIACVRIEPCFDLVNEVSMHDSLEHRVSVLVHL